ncbi:Polysaccharide biosynthesis protein [Candidatus Bealeia paramacronuclearis]|uniref:Polysaccharide biosynthesis protein n=1 Tax=Candidatus Bealeia paramacronuclearis TaxID=1921001 RepID=A0ABZ2C3R5_9PROT|nr:Polysaccharide biosynthesis protein [Candidatus Bealeia paramacronuclearis]
MRIEIDFKGLVSQSVNLILSALKKIKEKCQPDLILGAFKKKWSRTARETKQAQHDKTKQSPSSFLKNIFHRPGSWTGRKAASSRYLIGSETFLSLGCFFFSFFLLKGRNIVNLGIGDFWVSFFLYSLCILGLQGLQIYQRGLWTFDAEQSSLRILSFSSLLTLIFAPLYFIVPQSSEFSGDFLILNWVLLNLILFAAHFCFELIEVKLKAVAPLEKRSLTRVILVGGDPYLSNYLQALLNRYDHRFEVLGVVLTMPTSCAALMDVPLLGFVQDLDEILNRLRLQERASQKLLVVDPYFRGEVLRQLWITALEEDVEVKIAEDDDNSDLPHLRSLIIEDFFKRLSLRSHQAALTPFFANTRILITGAGGTLGQALAKKLLKCKPHDLILVDHDENRLTVIVEELSHQDLYVRIHPHLASIRHKVGLEAIFAQHKPEIVLHAAGLKHIPVVEDNPMAAFETNLLGLRNLADVSRAHQVRSFVALSTLGAQNPHNLLEALKHLEETYALSLDAVERHKPQGTQFLPIRFGNIAMSPGSVLEKIYHQVESLRPITLTHPESERSFHCLEDVVNLILESLLYHSHYSGASRVYVIEPDQPQRIQSLAEDMIRLKGLRPHHDISMKLLGLRSGDRLQETPFLREKFTATEVPHLWHKTPKVTDFGFISRAISEIETSISKNELGKVLSILSALVPEYSKNHASGEAKVS